MRPTPSLLWLCAALPLVVACSSEPEPTPPTTQDPDALTWATHIQPLMAEHCTSCHVEGGAAPFALDTFESLETYGALALDSMTTKRMPPWQADPDCKPVMNARIMPEEEIETFRTWWNGDRIRGEATAAPQETEQAISFSPTHTAGLPTPYTPTLGEADDYRCFVLDLEFDKTMYLTGSNVLPGNGLVHHVLVYALTDDQAEEALMLDAAEDGPGYTCFGGPVPLGGEEMEGGMRNLAETLAGFNLPNQIGGWVPGSTPTLQRDDTAIRIAQGSKIVMQIHYSAVAGEEMADSKTEYQAILTEEAPAWLARSRPVAQRNLEIPAGMSGVNASISLPYYGDDPLVITGMAGHMHLLGTSLKAEVERASGGQECGLNLPDWDFDWQESYEFDPAQPLTLASGDRLSLECSYDNSLANQPVINGTQQDPRDVAWGDGTLDEMCLLYIVAREEYTPEPSASSRCSTGCVEQCQGDVACLAKCESDFSCAGCAVGEGLRCDAGRACLGSVLGARACLTTCASSAIMLGGNFGACMEAECATPWQTLSTCVTDALQDPTCAEAAQTCGL